MAFWKTEGIEKRLERELFRFEVSGLGELTVWGSRSLVFAKDEWLGRYWALAPSSVRPSIRC